MSSHRKHRRAFMWMAGALAASAGTAAVHADWPLEAVLQKSVTQENALFGWSVACGDGFAVVGVPGAYLLRTGQGCANSFTKIAGTWYPGTGQNGSAPPACVRARAEQTAVARATDGCAQNAARRGRARAESQRRSPPALARPTGRGGHRDGRGQPNAAPRFRPALS
jgi:hypothetical protein